MQSYLFLILQKCILERERKKERSSETKQKTKKKQVKLLLLDEIERIVKNDKNMTVILLWIWIAIIKRPQDPVCNFPEVVVTWIS